jgi:signal peptidase II
METEKQQSVSPAVSVGRLWDRSITLLPDRKAHLIFWPMWFLGLALDLWSKRAVFAWLEYKSDQSAEIIDGILSFRLALNDGAAFGIATGRYSFLVAVLVLALIVILGVFFFGRTRQWVFQVALGLFAAGVSGNLWDRLFNHGLVRDFVDVVYWPGKHWYTFNVADSMLCIAVVLLIVVTLLTDLSCRTRAQPRK